MFTCLSVVSLTAWCEGEWSIALIHFGVLMSAALLYAAGSGFSAASGPAAITQWLLLGAAGWGCVQILMQWTVYAYATLASIPYWSAAAGLFWIGGQLFRGEDRDLRWMDRFLSFGGVLTALCLGQRFSSGGQFLWLFDSGYTDIYGPFASYMDFAAFAELAFPLALWRTLIGRPRAWVSGCIAALLCASVVMSASRAGTVLIAAEFVSVAGLAAARRPELRRRIGVAVPVVAALAVSLSLAAGWERLWERLRENDPYAFRRNVLLSAAEMIRQRPWTGFGLGNFPTAYPAYARFDDGTRVNHAHNEWAEWAAEGGLPLAAAMLLLAALAVRLAVSSIWGVGLLFVLLHSLVDYPLRHYGVAGWFFFILARLHARTPTTGAWPTSA